MKPIEGAKDRIDPSSDELVATPRFTRRWHLIGAGLSNVWRFGNLELPAASGRLLLRGPNGTGKTTVLEALAPYILDLNGARMSAGKARTTNLSSLMREGGAGKRRCGYAWLTLSEARQGIWSFGVRIQYADGASPPVRVVPFAVPGRPLHELTLYGPAGAALPLEQFCEAVAACGGRIFEDEDAYVAHLAAHVFGTPNPTDVANLTARLRQVRNPTLLGDVSPQVAAEALRESLPGVAEDVISATAEALAETDTTREAFNQDKKAAETLEEFCGVWSAHATEVVGAAHAAAELAAGELRAQLARVRTRAAELAGASTAAGREKDLLDVLLVELAGAKSEVNALENHSAYRDAGRLVDLRRAAAAQASAADSAAQVMRLTAKGVAAECDAMHRELQHIAEDLEEHSRLASSADPGADGGSPLLTNTLRPRAALHAGTIAVDPGATLEIHGDPRRLREVASSWLELARIHEERSDAAALAHLDHKTVEAAAEAAAAAAVAAEEAATRADGEFGIASRAQEVAKEAARVLLAAVHSWTESHSRLGEPQRVTADATAGASSRGAPWSPEEVRQSVDAEPGQALALCDSWARHATARAEGMAGELLARARAALREAAARREEARVLLAEVEALRSGRLLPLPRPDWAGPGEDGVALGAALEWRDSFADPTARALLEAALAAAGLLGASLGMGGAATRCWRVEQDGPAVGRNLTEFLAVDAAHPRAAEATTVLERVPVVSSADLQAPNEAASGVHIGLDGTFRAGVLRGRAPGADEPTALAPASHVGARQRRAAALLHADLLDDKAAQLQKEASLQECAAASLESDADAVSALADTFPLRDDLRAAEAHRVETWRAARELREVARVALETADRAQKLLRREREEWLQRTRSRGLPGEPEELLRLRDRGAEAAGNLRDAAGPVGGKLAERLERALAGYSADVVALRLVQAEAGAQEAHRIATDAQTAMRVLEETAGAAISDVLARHADANRRLSALQEREGPARSSQLESARSHATAEANLAEAERKLREELGPRAAQQLAALRKLLGVAGVADAVLDGEQLASEANLLKQVAAKLPGRRTLIVRTMLERADAARTKLAGIWSVDPGDTHGALLTYVLSYRDSTYTPIEAATCAKTLRARAEQALAANEERALREFIVGRLPGAIGAAWTRLHDWSLEVNRKMRAAAASSGVGVQVRTPLREDLAAASREVYELCCRVSSAERTPEQQRRLGEALQSLLAPSGTGTMHERVASAVDIRDWVEVHYEVMRPGGKQQRWSAKTGLSGGERRLVVLAPMLAAIAAGYDRLGASALRLVTLDEVPAEVDESGREGLARYLAELDLDLICTSYLWDGCPGAWDGVDAHDLEAGPDGTVVAFPMLVRGISEIPEPLAKPVASATEGSR